MIEAVSTVITPATATAPAGPYDLTTLANARDELKLKSTDTSQDSFLSRAITQASYAIASYCNRVFAVEGISDLFFHAADRRHEWRPGPPLIQLNRWPVAKMATLKTSADTASGAVLPFASTSGVATGQPASGLNIPAGATVASFVADTSVTLSAPVLGDVPSGTAITCGFAASENGAPQTLVLDTDFRLDPSVSQLTRIDSVSGCAIHWRGFPLTVLYSAGYSPIPPDLEMACLRLVTERFYRRGVDPSLREQETPGVGRRVWWVDPRRPDGIPDEIVALIDNYRIPAFG